jgi:hypothetical protein
MLAFSELELSVSLSSITPFDARQQTSEHQQQHFVVQYDVFISISRILHLSKEYTTIFPKKQMSL